MCIISEAFFGGCVAIMALMAVSEIGIVHIFYKGDMGQPLSDTARRLCFERIAPLMGMRSYVDSLKKDRNDERSEQRVQVSVTKHCNALSVLWILGMPSLRTCNR